MTTTRRRTASAPAPQRVTNDDVREELRMFAARVIQRLEKAPRFQSIGRNKYVYVGDVEQAMEKELYGGAEG